MPKSYVCLYQQHASDLPKCLEKALKNSNDEKGYDAVAVPIINPLFYREFENEPIKSRHIAFSRPDIILSASDWLYKVISVLSDDIDCDSEDYNIRRHSEETLMQELSFADHLVQHGYLLMKIKSGKTVNLARIISKSIKGILLAAIPMSDPNYIKKQWRKDIEEGEMEKEDDTWHWWNRFRSAADFNMKIRVALELSSDIPSEEVLQRWLGEPVDCLIIPTHLFTNNEGTYPKLSRPYQELVRKFITNNVNIIIKGNLNDERILLYAHYAKKLLNIYKEVDLMPGFDDLLEIPLQPLYDNLDSYTYEVFEKDPIKYRYYQQAIELALIDKVPESKISEKTVIIMVVGAGRGPLVRAALNASENTKRKVKIYIIEKNPNAIITLTALIEEMWSEKDIQLFSKDMRDFTPPEKADILVSELLGSFGDNELSPECLDGAQKHLKKDGISIPCESTSYVNPVMSSKIFNFVRQILVERNGNPREKINAYMTQAENTYVIYLKNVYHIAKPQSLFKFQHPNKENVINNTRFKVLKFKVSQDCVLHGFAGYFDTILYKHITLSIHPETHSKGLSSWFSFYFPFTEPQQLKAGDTLEVNFWRCTSIHKVWYEWSTSTPHMSHIHNHNGRSCYIFK